MRFPRARPRLCNELGRRLAARPRPRAGRRLRVVRADASHLAGARAGGDARRARRAGPDRVRAAAERQADHRHRAAHGLLARRRARVRGRGGRGARQQRVLRPGPVDAVADVRVGRDRGRRRDARQGRRAGARADGARGRLRARRRVLRGGDEPQPVGDVLRRSQPRQARRLLRDVAAVRPRPRRRQRRVLPRLRPRARARALPLPAAVRGQLAPGAGARRRRPRGRDPRRRRAAAGRGGHSAHLPPDGPEQGRRLRRRHRAELDRPLQRLGRARARRRRPQPARPEARPDRLRPRAPARRQRPRRDRPHDPAPPRRGREAEAGQPRPRQGGARQAPPQRLLLQPREHDLVRDLRPPRRGPRRRQP